MLNKKMLCLLLALCLSAGSFGLHGAAGWLNAADTKEILSRFSAAAVADPEPVKGVVRGEQSDTADTYTGLEPLPSVQFSSADPSNTKGLSVKIIEHSYGVAKDGKPHSISVECQNSMEKSGYDAVVYDAKSAAQGKKYLYLTFDCGYENGNTAVILDALREKNVPAAFFCTLYQVKSQPELTARMIKEGHIVGNHSCSHPNFGKISGVEMAKELEGFENFMRTEFGYSAAYFRYPEGAYSEYALSEVCANGFKVCFWSLAYADWDENNQKGGDYAFETVMSRLHPGAVILLHSVSADNAAAMGRIIDAARAQGYEFRSLTEL